jgi:S-adenosylmethionine decarboxylase
MEGHAMSRHLGFHIVADISGVPFHVLNDLDYLRDLFKAAAEKAKVTILAEPAHKFEPQGVTLGLLLSESHLTIHTWPELGAACIDFFTCGPKDNARAGMRFLIDELKPTAILTEENIRRVPTANLAAV